MAPNATSDEGDLAPHAESYATFWDAIPIDPAGTPPAAPLPPIMGSEDPYADFLNLTEEGAASWLTVEQTDVG